ncbi:HSP20-like chaperone [Thelephora terrestris]|uniref:HSP20-like chaperone n=1 Tax=Thelephora terrestris TaxID=56493 RepID=A0A9P6HCY7_9AGAM|nr:HSP20-like chaperone [Thelephora terrestris]
MSLSRNFLREFRPLFRMLEDPFLGRAPVAYSGRGRSVFDDPLLGLAQSGLRPAVDVAEEGNSYIIEAELPGVRKEDINVEIGENGRSVTIQGKIVRRARQQEQPIIDAPANAEAQASSESNKISVERESTGHTTFTRSITLPSQVDPSKVSAKLADGVLTLEIPKAEEAGRVKIDIE